MRNALAVVSVLIIAVVAVGSTARQASVAARRSCGDPTTQVHWARCRQVGRCAQPTGKPAPTPDQVA
jgi:hypothetical protein